MSLAHKGVLLIAVILGGWALLPAAARSEVIYDAAYPPSDPFFELNHTSFQKVAASFKTTASEYVLTGMQWVLQSPSDGTLVRDIRFSIYDNNSAVAGGAPGNALYSNIYTQSVQTLGATPTLNGPQGLSLNLSPDTFYWAVIDLTVPLAAGQTGPLSYVNRSGPATGLSQGSGTFNGSSWGVIPWALAGNVTAQAVPEPSTVGLAAGAVVAFGGLTIMRRRRRAGQASTRLLGMR